MRILLVGGTGLLGRAVHAALVTRHQVIVTSRGTADLSVDITQPESIAALYQQGGMFDAVACAAGKVPWAALEDLTYDALLHGAQNKLLGQVELVRQGIAHLSPAGSFTLISGVLADEPVPGSTAAAMTNGALESFVRSVAIELPHRQRINAVSPTVFTEALDTFGTVFPGFDPVPVERAARAYVKSIEGAQTGQIYRVR
jgi:NAD(P)-dependent dehydrogenase (short-subunit alcohol dehydrogenase family)